MVGLQLGKVSGVFLNFQNERIPLVPPEASTTRLQESSRLGNLFGVRLPKFCQERPSKNDLQRARSFSSSRFLPDAFQDVKSSSGIEF